MNNFPLRLPPDIEAAIRQLAKEHDRTINKEIIQACKSWIQMHKEASLKRGARQ